MANLSSPPDWWALPRSMKDDIIGQAIEMEKEQIFEAWDNGFANGYDLGKYNDECSPEDADKYYNETYESKTNI